MDKNKFEKLKYPSESLNLTQERLRLLSKSKTIAILGSLVNTAKGKSFSELQFDLRVNSSTLSATLKTLQEIGYVSRVDNIYTATESGENSLGLLTSIAKGVFIPEQTSTSKKFSIVPESVRNKKRRDGEL